MPSLLVFLQLCDIFYRELEAHMSDQVTDTRINSNMRESHLAPIYAKFIDMAQMGQLHRKRYKKSYMQRRLCRFEFVSSSYPLYSSLLFSLEDT
jgi:hypothetical protein